MKSLLSNLGVPASSAERSAQNRRMQESLRLQEEDRIAELDRSRLADIESRRRWEETYAEMGLDDIIEIPGKCGGEDIVLRVIPSVGGRLTFVD